MSWSLHRFARWRNRHSPGCTELHRSRIPGFEASAVQNDGRAAPARSSHHSTVRARPQTISLADFGDASACQGALDALRSISSNRSSMSDPLCRSPREKSWPSCAIGARISEPPALDHGSHAGQQPHPDTGRRRRRSHRRVRDRPFARHQQAGRAYAASARQHPNRSSGRYPPSSRTLPEQVSAIARVAEVSDVDRRGPPVQQSAIGLFEGHGDCRLTEASREARGIDHRFFTRSQKDVLR